MSLIEEVNHIKLILNMNKWEIEKYIYIESLFEKKPWFFLLKQYGSDSIILLYMLAIIN